MMKKALPLTLVLIGIALLITAVVFWIDSNNSAQPQDFGQSLRDWITLIAGLGASIKGWIDLVKKETPSQPTHSNQDGGVIIGGSVGSVGKDVIGRDQVITTNIVSEDNAYNVDGLPNPYLGLQAFTYSERDRYAGREKATQEALQLLVSPDEQRNLLFVTGASGSGKSSFVQASILPALISYYEQNGKVVKFEVFRPSHNPKSRLDEVLKRLGSPNVEIIVIDQFEELFTQSIPNERDSLVGFLKQLQPSEKIHRIIIATLRSDYLGEMFDVQWLWEIAKQGIELREMRVQELKDAIVRPLLAKYPNGGKRIDAKLVERLASDTAENITYLPLLQVTLEDIWNKGQLKLGSYNSLTDAIKERADTVLAYHDFDKASPNSKRSEVERDEILNLLLDLINPSLDDDTKHDVRIGRKLTDFDDEKVSLVHQLSKARLVSVDIEDGFEVVNLIHETLIRSWDVLGHGVKEKRLQLQKRVRFEEQLRVWIAQNKADDFLLSKGLLAEALDLEQANDIALKNAVALDYLKKSIDQAQKAEEFQIMGQISREINASLEVEHAMHITLEYAMRRSNTEAGLIGIINGNNLRLMAQQGYDEILAGEDGIDLPLDLLRISTVIESKQPIQFSLLNAGRNGILPSAAMQVIIPICRENNVIGLLLLEGSQAIQVNLEFLTQLSESAAISIANAQLYNEVQRANRAKSEFVAFIANQLKNPMTSIKGYTELLAAGSVGPINDMQANFLSTIRANVQRMSSLVSDLNDDTKIEATNLRLEYERLSVDTFVNEVIQSTKRQIDEKKQMIEIKIPQGLPNVWTDHTRVAQVLTNLVSNAHKYTPERGEIQIGAEATGNQWDPDGAREVVHFWVKDNGIGISIEDQAKIFQRFFRSGDSKAREAPGTGLGLNITKSLVEMMGGRIWFDSEFRKGTTFHFTIPVAEV